MSDVPIARPVEACPTPITEDMPCMLCGYNLRGLRTNGRCPECGSPIERSVHGNLLRYTDADWLAKPLLGIRLMLWSIVIGIIVGVVGGLLVLLGSPRTIVAGMAVVMAGLEVAAALLITVQEPRISLSETSITWRKVVRIGATVAFLGQILQQVGTTLSAVRGLAIVGAALSLAGIAAFVGKLIYLRQFALRIPNAKLARSTRIVMVGYGISVAMGLIMGLFSLIFVMGAATRAALFSGVAGATTAPATGPVSFPMPSTQMPLAVTSGPTTSGPAAIPPWGTAPPSAPALGGVIALGAAGCFSGVGSLVFGIWYLILLVQYRNAFREALSYAQRYAAAAG